MGDWNPNDPGTIGLEWFPNQIGGTPSTQGRAIATSLPSTATETIANLWVGFHQCTSPGRWLAEVFTAGSEVPTGQAVASGFVPDSDLSNLSNLWQNQAGSAVNIFGSIDNGTVNPASYITYAGSFGANNAATFTFGTSGWPTARRVFGLTFTFTASAESSAVGRMQVIYRATGGTNYTLGQVSLTNSVETFSFTLGEINPATGLPWTEAQIEALATTAGFGFRALSGASVQMRVFDASLSISYATENRLAVGEQETLTTLETPEWVTFALQNPTSGAANWSKANATDYTVVVRPISTTGAIPGALTAGQGTVRTLDSGLPLPTGVVGYRPLIDSAGAVVSMGDEFTFGMSLALDVNASATDSADGQPYISYITPIPAGVGQTVNGATADVYELLRFYVSFSATTGAEPTVEDVEWSISTTAPVVLDSGTITAADIEEAPYVDFTSLAGLPASYIRVFGPFEVECSVTLAAATTYRLRVEGSSSTLAAVPLLTTSDASNTHGDPATYGGTTLDWNTNDAIDAPITLSTVPDPVTGLSATYEQFDTSNLGCNPTQIPYIVFRWNPSSLGADFGYYEIAYTVDGITWTDIAHVTDETATRFEWKEFPFGTALSLRIRVVRAGDLIASDWRATQAITVDAPECVYYITSNFLTDQLAYNPGDRTTWQFPSADETQIAPRAGDDYQQALIASEWRGDRFEVDLSVWLPDQTSKHLPPPGGRKRWSFDPLIEMTRAAVPYLCVRDETGRMWFANVNVEEATANSSAVVPNNVATVVINEITAAPALVDIDGDAPLLLLRTSTLPDDYNPEDPWPNEGYGGTPLDARPVTVRSGLVSFDDPPVIAAHTNTNQTTAYTTPYSAALGITGDMSMACKARGVGDLLDSGTEFHSMAAAKIRTLTIGPGWDEPDYGITIGIEPGFERNKMCALWTDTSNIQHAVSGGPELDPLEWNEYAWALDVDNGAGGHTVTFYLGDGEGNFTEVDEVTISGTTDIRDIGGPLVAASFTMLVEYVHVLDAGVLVASFQPEDSGILTTGEPVGPAKTWVSSNTGETWTVGTDSTVYQAPSDRMFIVGSLTGLEIPDQAALDIGTSDWTIALDVYSLGNLNNGQAWQSIAKRSGSPLGSGGVGWQAMTIRIDGLGLLGEGYVLSDGTDTAIALSTAGGARKLLVVTFDRSGDMTLYVNGVEEATASIAAVGDISTVTDMLLGIFGQPPVMIGAHAQWPRALTAAEVGGLASDLADPDWPGSQLQFPYLP